MATYYPERYVNLNDYLPRDSFDYVFDGVPTLLYPKKTYVDTAYAILQKSAEYNRMEEKRDP